MKVRVHMGIPQRADLGGYLLAGSSCVVRALDHIRNDPSSYVLLFVLAYGVA